nr:hypothetical protein BgiMline_006995 [Biomphalaria glabrata]
MVASVSIQLKKDIMALQPQTTKWTGSAQPEYRLSGTKRNATFDISSISVGKSSKTLHTEFNVHKHAFRKMNTSDSSLRSNLFYLLNNHQKVTGLISETDDATRPQKHLIPLFISDKKTGVQRFSKAPITSVELSNYRVERDTSLLNTDCGSLTPERCQAIRLRMCVTICVDSYMVIVCRRRQGCSIIRN